MRGIVVVVALAGALAGCTGDPPAAAPSPSPSAASTPLSAFDSRGVAVARADLCGLVPDDAVAAAVGGEAPTGTAYGEGDRARVVPGVRDRSGEFDCTWTGADGTVARAWVFAPPVSRERARGLVRLVAAQDGCRRVDGPAYGDPTVATLCRAGAARTAAYAGLFVDAWLSCSVAGPASAADLRARAGEWCVAVARAGAG